MQERYVLRQLCKDQNQHKYRNGGADLKLILLCFSMPRSERLLPMTYGKILGKSFLFFFSSEEKGIREEKNLMVVFLLLREEYSKVRAKLLLPCVG